MYKEIWSPFIGDTFISKHERGNAHDRYAMAIVPDDMKRKRTVPKDISKICCLFVFRGGTITGRVTGARTRT